MSAATPASWLPPKGIHNVSIGSSMRRSLATSKRSPAQAAQPSGYDFVAMRYNLKPASVANASGSLTPIGAPQQKDALELELNSETGERHAFNVRVEAKKEVDCVLFYDPVTGTLVLERLDGLLALTHQRSSSRDLHISAKNPRKVSTPSRPPPSSTLHQQTVFPPTPPATALQGFSALPDPNGTKDRNVPSSRHDRISHQENQENVAEKAPAALTSSGKPTSNTPNKRRAPQTMSDYAQEQRRLQQSKSGLSKHSGSDLASDPDEEELVFGKPTTTTSSTSSPSQNALLLSDIPSRRAKRKFSDSEPDEEELEFGRPSVEIKRPKTASQSPLSVSHGTPGATGSLSDSAPSPSNFQTAPNGSLQSIPSRSSAAMGSKMVHGSSPLATAQIISSDSGSEDDEDDDDSSSSEDEAPIASFSHSRNTEPHITHPPAQSMAEDMDDDDFLAAAFIDDDEDGGMAQEDSGMVQVDAYAAPNQYDDSSDESDYEER